MMGMGGNHVRMGWRYRINNLTCQYRVRTLLDLVVQFITGCVVAPALC